MIRTNLSLVAVLAILVAPALGAANESARREKTEPSKEKFYQQPYARSRLALISPGATFHLPQLAAKSPNAYYMTAIFTSVIFP